MSQTILVVDDEPRIVDLVTTILEGQGYRVIEAGDGDAAITALREQLPDLVLLDVMLPGQDGFTILKEIRRTSNVPVIMLTVQASEADKVRGLELGADDYMAKPFGPRERVSGLKAVLRRAEMPPAQPVHSLVEIDPHLAIDFDTREVVVDGERIKLRPTEYKLLYHLVRNAGHVLQHGTLLAKVWGREYVDEVDYVRVYIRRLREKLGDDPENPRYIQTERRLGYRFIAPGGRPRAASR